MLFDTGPIWQALDVGKSPRVPNNLIHGQISQHCLGVGCQCLPRAKLDQSHGAAKAHHVARACDNKHTTFGARVQLKKFCFVDNRRMQAWGLQKLGYASWEALWGDYTVFASVRNPYDRVASAYDYIIGRREVWAPPPHLSTWFLCVCVCV